MSYRPRNSEKPKKKSKKTKSITNAKKTQKVTKVKSKDVAPPSSVTKSAESAGLKWHQETARKWDPYEDGNYAKMPYETPNEVNFIGGIGANVGHRRSKKYINRTTRVQQIYNMRNDNRPIFSFIEDPQIANNVPARALPPHTTEDDTIFFQNTVDRIGGIKHEQSLEVTETSDICPPPNLSKTWKQSDTNLSGDHVEMNRNRNHELRKQFLDQKRALIKEHIETQLPIDLGFEHRKEKFKLSEYFDVDKNIPEEEDIESAREIIVDWTEKYTVRKHECDLKFGRPMPEAIPMPLDREKLAFLTRTLDKQKNVGILEQEIKEFSKQIEENALTVIEQQDTAYELERMLRKHRAKNFSKDLAINDFEGFMKASRFLNVSEPDITENVESTQMSRREQLNIAMQKFEEMIAQQLSTPDETNSFNNISQFLNESDPSNEKCAANINPVDGDKKIPVDFTHAFDTSVKEKKLNQTKGKRYKEKENEGTSLENSKSQLKSSSDEGIKMVDDSSSVSQENQKKLPEHDRKRDSQGESVEVKEIKKSASVCTYFTDDSGSFIIVQGKKLHLDHLKPMKRSSEENTKILIHDFDEYLQPYKVLPLNEAKKYIKRDPKLVPTFDIKERLKIELPTFESELIGTDKNKYHSHLATEWDEYYQKEILNRPRIRRFKPRTIMKQIVDSLRLKYESIYKREYLTEKSIVIEQEKLFTKRAEQFRDVCLAFFSNLQTMNYRQSMAKIQDLRPMYELNDELTSELTNVSNKLIQLKTAIIRAEGKVREATILQNVSYLMKDLNWREKNDWIHKRSDGTLETIKESIEQRMTTNLRKRDNDNVWLIKEFFENNIFNNRRPALVAFDSPDSISRTIANFKVQLYLSLLKLDLSTWILINLKHAYNTYCKWSSDFIEQRKKYVEARCARKYFLDVCAANLKKDAVQLINGKLADTISEKTLRTLEPLCNTLFLNVIPKNIQEQLEGGNVLSKFRVIIAQAMYLLEQLDDIPLIVRKEVEKNIRKENGFIERRTKRAVDLENHIDKVRKVMIKHSTPPFKRQPRTEKLPRSRLPKPKPAPKIVPPDDDTDFVHLAITEQDFDAFLKEPPPSNEFYLDPTFFGGDIEIPNIDFLPEMKSNLNEFIVDVKNVLQKWEQNKQGRYLEDAHNAWTTKFTE